MRLKIIKFLYNDMSESKRWAISLFRAIAKHNKDKSNQIICKIKTLEFLLGEEIIEFLRPEHNEELLPINIIKTDQE